MAEFPEVLQECTGFQWDVGNADKNWERHTVSQGESEQVFFQRPITIVPDRKHSKQEPRYAVLGQTASGRRLTIVFTIRGNLIRVISARDMSRAERRRYERTQETD